MTEADSALDGDLVLEGERIAQRLRLSRDEIARFAALTGDRNPLHRDALAAQRAGFGDVIASGQQATALMMGLLASHFSRSDDGIAREMLCLNVNFAFKTAVLAGQDIELAWTVHSAQWHERLGGMLAQLDGQAGRPGAEPSVVARATILVKQIV